MHIKANAKPDPQSARCCRQRGHGAQAPTKERDMTTLQSLIEPKMAKFKRHHAATSEVAVSVAKTELVALENGRANERRIAARGKMRCTELQEQRCVLVPIQHLRCYRDDSSNRAGAGV